MAFLVQGIVGKSVITSSASGWTAMGSPLNLWKKKQLHAGTGVLLAFNGWATTDVIITVYFYDGDPEASGTEIWRSTFKQQDAAADARAPMDSFPYGIHYGTSLYAAHNLGTGGTELIQLMVNYGV